MCSFTCTDSCSNLAVIVLLELCKVAVVLELPEFAIVTSPPVTVQPENLYPVFGVAVILIAFSTW